MRTSGYVFFIALARVLRGYYFVPMSDCSRYWDNEHRWVRRSLTRVDNVLSSDKISKTMRKLWDELFVWGRLPTIEASQGLGVCMRLCFLEDVCRDILQEMGQGDEVEDASLSQSVERFLGEYSRRSVQRYLSAITTKAWKYLAPDWLMARLQLDAGMVSMPSDDVPANYAQALGKMEDDILSILSDEKLSGVRRGCDLAELYRACFR